MLEQGIYNMDCLKGMTLIDDRSIDFIFCDLPYGITANDWDTPIDMTSLWDSYNRIIKDNGAIVLFGKGKFSAKLIMSNLKMYRYTIIWHKTTPVGFLNANKMPLASHEDMLVFYKKLPTYNPQKTYGHKRVVVKEETKKNCKKGGNYEGYEMLGYDSTERYPTSVWTFSNDKQKENIHPTQKPIDLCKKMILTYTNPGEIVMDNCCGSGSICKAAKLTNRKYIGFDNGKNLDGVPWAQIATERLSES